MQTKIHSILEHDDLASCLLEFRQDLLKTTDYTLVQNFDDLRPFDTVRAMALFGPFEDQCAIEVEGLITNFTKDFTGAWLAPLQYEDWDIPLSIPVSHKNTLCLNAKSLAQGKSVIFKKAL